MMKKTALILTILLFVGISTAQAQMRKPSLVFDGKFLQNKTGLYKFCENNRWIYIYKSIGEGIRTPDSVAIAITEMSCDNK